MLEYLWSCEALHLPSILQLGAVNRLKTATLVIHTRQYFRLLHTASEKLTIYRSSEDSQCVVLEQEDFIYYARVPEPIVSLSVKNSILTIICSYRRMYTMGINYLSGSSLEPQFFRHLPFEDRLSYLRSSPAL